MPTYHSFEAQTFAEQQRGVGPQQLLDECQIDPSGCDTCKHSTQEGLTGKYWLAQLESEVQLSGEILCPPLGFPDALPPDMDEDRFEKLTIEELQASLGCPKYLFILQTCSIIVWPSRRARSLTLQTELLGPSSLHYMHLVRFCRSCCVGAGAGVIAAQVTKGGATWSCWQHILLHVAEHMNGTERTAWCWFRLSGN